VPLAPSHVFEDHAAEVRLRVEAPTLESLFYEAALGLVDLLVRGAVRPSDGPEEIVTLEAEDTAALLVDWINELVYRSETRHKVYAEIHVESATETTLRARIRGFEPAAIVTAVKAATLHDVDVSRQKDGWGARVVLDV
jgi:SHS2 domain-containing protein